MSEPYTPQGYVEYVFRDHGLHPSSIIAAVGGVVRVSVPPWEMREAKALAERISMYRGTRINLRRLNRPREEGTECPPPTSITSRPSPTEL